MIELNVDGHIHRMLTLDENCPICDKPLAQASFRWQIFHGEAKSSCCGASYQIKDYFIENPSEDQKKLLEMLKGEYIEFLIKDEWIQPLKKVMNQTGSNYITEEVIESASKILNPNHPQA